MGNGCLSKLGCNERPHNEPEESDPLRFYDSYVKIINYTVYFREAKSLQELTELMPNYIIYEVKCIKSPKVDFNHSYVQLLGTSSCKPKQLCFEVSFKSFGRLDFKILIPKSTKSAGKTNGEIELVHYFSTSSKARISDIINWLEAYKKSPFAFLSDEEDNAGRVIYSFVRSL